MAFQYTVGGGALLAAVAAVVGSLGGTLMTQRSNRRGERERAEQAAKESDANRVHQRELREIDLRAERRARHYAGRQPAYQALGRACLDYKRAQAGSNAAFNFLRTVSTAEEPDAEDVSEAQEQFKVAAYRTRERQVEYETALADVGTVASRVVYEAAAHVERCVRGVGIRQRALELADPKNPLDVQEANLSIKEGWEAP